MIETFNFSRSLPSMLVLFYGVCINVFVKSLVFKPTFIHIIHTYFLNVSRGTLFFSQWLSSWQWLQVPSGDFWKSHLLKQNFLHGVECLKQVGSLGFLSFSHWYNMIKHASCLNYNFASNLKKLVGTSNDEIDYITI